MPMGGRRHRCLPRAEQGNGFVDATLPGIGALGGGDVVAVIPLHAVGELARERAGWLAGRERGGEVGQLLDGPSGTTIPVLLPVTATVVSNVTLLGLAAIAHLPFPCLVGWRPKSGVNRRARVSVFIWDDSGVL
jgi:hypothetical protein